MNFLKIYKNCQFGDFILKNGQILGFKPFWEM